MSHELTYCIYRYVAENLVILAKGDKRNATATSSTASSF